MAGSQSISTLAGRMSRISSTPAQAFKRTSGQLGHHSVASVQPGTVATAGSATPSTHGTPPQPASVQTPLSQRTVQAATTEEVRQRMRASGGFPEATKRRLDLSVWGRFNPAKDRAQTIAKAMAHLDKCAGKPRFPRMGGVASPLGADMQDAMADAAAGGIGTTARHDNDMLMYVGFKIAARYDHRDNVPPVEVAYTFMALIEEAMARPDMNPQALQFLTAGFFPGLTKEAAHITAVMFFNKYGTQADPAARPKIEAIAEGLSMTMSDAIRKRVKTTLKMQQSSQPAAPGGSARPDVRHLLKSVDSYRDTPDRFWRDRLQTTLKEIDGHIFDRREYAQALRAKWQWPGPARKKAGAQPSGQASPAAGSSAASQRPAAVPTPGASRRPSISGIATPSGAPTALASPTRPPWPTPEGDDGDEGIESFDNLTEDARALLETQDRVQLPDEDPDMDSTGEGGEGDTVAPSDGAILVDELGTEGDEGLDGNERPEGADPSPDPQAP